MRRADPVEPKRPIIGARPAASGDRADLGAGESVDGLVLERLDLAGADLAGLVLDGCALAECTADDAVLDDARLLDTRIEGLTASAVRLVGATLRDVRVDRCRLGAAEAYSGEWTRVEVAGSRIDYLNLSGARVDDVTLSDCAVGELDLRAATVHRLALRGVRVGTLSLAGATLDALDLRGAQLTRLDGASGLRGAIVSADQLALLAPLLAEAAGVTVAE